jgi:hypothetical protein
VLLNFSKLNFINIFQFLVFTPKNLLFEKSLYLPFFIPSESIILLIGFKKGVANFSLFLKKIKYTTIIIKITITTIIIFFSGVLNKFSIYIILII